MNSNERPEKYSSIVVASEDVFRRELMNKTNELVHLPDILVFRVHRYHFASEKSKTATKIKDYFDFKDKLELQGVEYNICAAVLYKGNIADRNGHYIAVTKVGDDW